MLSKDKHSSLLVQSIVDEETYFDIDTRSQHILSLWT